MIVFEDVTKVYDPDVVGLDDVTCPIDKGEFVFLVGPSGSGKSTFIRLLIKEFEPTAARSRRRPQPRQRLRRSQGAAPAPQRSAASSRTSSSCADRTVYENVAYALQVIGENRALDPPQGPGDPGPGGPARQGATATPTSSPAASSSASRRARLRQPSAAADRRRAHGQPRPRDLRRDHAAALPHQPHRHDGDHGHARPRDGRTRCAGA